MIPYRPHRGSLTDAMKELAKAYPLCSRNDRTGEKGRI